MTTHPLYLGNRPQQPNADLQITDKFTGEVVARVALADDKIIDEAISLAQY